MSESVIDYFETVEIQNHHCVAPVVGIRVAKSGLHPLLEQDAIREMGQAVEVGEEPDAFLISTANLIDITEAVRQYSETAAAIQPLCRADCPGLCPVCGIDLSMNRCDCDREPADPRWAALAALKRSQG